MKDAEVIDSIMVKLSKPVGRHLYGVLGSYRSLERFSGKLQEAKTLDGKPFPKPLSVNRGILETIPDDEFRKLVQDEAKRPEPTADHVKQAFESFLRTILQKDGLVILKGLEMLFAYNVDLNALRTMAADEFRIILLLPGRRDSGKIFMFPPGEGPITYNLPTNLIAEDHLWEIRD